MTPIALLLQVGFPATRAAWGNAMDAAPSPAPQEPENSAPAPRASIGRRAEDGLPPRVKAKKTWKISAALGNAGAKNAPALDQAFPRDRRQRQRQRHGSRIAIADLGLRAPGADEDWMTAPLITLRRTRARRGANHLLRARIAAANLCGPGAHHQRIDDWPRPLPTNAQF